MQPVNTFFLNRKRYEHAAARFLKKYVPFRLKPNGEKVCFCLSALIYYHKPYRVVNDF